EAKMRPRLTPLPCRADVAEHCFRGDGVTRSDVRRVRIQMCTVIDSSSRAKNGNSLAAQSGFSDPHHVPFGRRIDGRSAFREDVLSLMQALAVARRVPAIPYLLHADGVDGHDKLLVRLSRIKLSHFQVREGAAGPSVSCVRNGCPACACEEHCKEDCGR